MDDRTPYAFPPPPEPTVPLGDLVHDMILGAQQQAAQILTGRPDVDVVDLALTVDTPDGGTRELTTYSFTRAPQEAGRG